MEWICTDPDNNQWGRKLGDKRYEFKQDTKYPNGTTTHEQIEINLNDYSDDEINNHLAPFSWSIEKLKNETNLADAEWLMAECIFEQTI